MKWTQSVTARWVVVIGLGAAAVAAMIWMRFGYPRLGDRVYRIGWEEDPPYQVRGEDGGPTGLAVELVREAARRRGVRLEWVRRRESSELSLRAKSVDLWPLVTITAERKKFIHITDPYLETEHCFVVRAGSAYMQQRDLDAASITHFHLPIIVSRLRTLFPRAQLHTRSSVKEAMDEVCEHRADAAFLEGYTAVSALLSGAVCRNEPLRLVLVPEMRSRLGVGATFEARAAADALRAEIGAIAREGKLAGMFGRWSYFSHQNLESLDALLDARRRERWLLAGIAGVAFLFLLTLWQAIRIRHERNLVRRAEAERSRLEQQLQQAQKLESIGRLAGGVAHDFNNLLTVINGYSDLVLNRLGRDHPLRAHVEEVRKAGERAAGLTEQLLAFSRKQVTKPRPLDLNTLVSETEGMLRRLVGEDVEVVTLLSPSLAQVMADPGQMHQVLMNLVANARDAMPSGGRLIIETANVELDEVYADVHPEVVPGPSVLLAVTDTGVGIDEETQRHIFEPFYTTKGPRAGTGLGLSMVYGIVRQSGGWIWVYSEPGKGSAFKIYLPVSEAVAQPEAGGRVAPVTLNGSETILVVEDQEEVRRLAVEVLRSYGYRILEAADGQAALALADRQGEPIHLLLTDVVMPGMTGRDLARRLAPLRPEMKVLYTSGYTENVIAHRGVLDAGVAYLPKPFTPEGLTTMVRKVLG